MCKGCWRGGAGRADGRRGSSWPSSPGTPNGSAAYESQASRASLTPLYDFAGLRRHVRQGATGLRCGRGAGWSTTAHLDDDELRLSFTICS